VAAENRAAKHGLHVNRSLIAAMAMPATALAAVGLVLLVVKHPTSPHSQIHHAAAPKEHAARSCIELPTARRFIGVAINPPLIAGIKSFGETTTVHPALVEFYTRFGAPFRVQEARQAAEAGSVPLVQLNPRQAPLDRIAHGVYDRYLRRYAAEVRSFKCPLVLSFGHEMNGSWYPWGRPHTTPAQFIAAWRQIHHIFAAAHVTNVTWAWDPDRGGSPASQWWPGSAYVNWIGLDGYLRPGQTFNQIFGRQLADIRRLPSKPVFIAETGVAPSAGAAHQITALFNGLKHYHLTGLVWFDINRLEQWRLQGRPTAAKAFQRSAATMAEGSSTG
jgi:glycosyl hydrolase family 26